MKLVSNLKNQWNTKSMLVPILIFSAFISIGLSTLIITVDSYKFDSETLPVENIAYGDIVYTPVAGILPCAGVSTLFKNTKPQVMIQVIQKEKPVIKEDYVIDIKVPEYNLSDYNIDKVGYVSSTRLRIRKEPNTSSDIIGMLYFNDRVDYDISDNPEWAVINYYGDIAFISRNYIQDNYEEFVSHKVTNDRRKSYMDYKSIRKSSSPQYKLQSKAVTATNGIRVVDGRYCVALGSCYSHNVGQYVDVILKNGTIIPCIIGDCKADADTSDGNSVGNDGSVVEFIVDTQSLNNAVRSSGNCSMCSNYWNSEVRELRLYSKDFI